MGDWTQQVQPFNRVVISSLSPESIGAEMATQNLSTAPIAWPATDRAFYVPFLVYAPLIAVKMICVNAGTVSGNVDLGIYDDQQDQLVHMGSTAQSGTTAVQSFDITDTTLEPGVYYMAMNMDNTTGTVIAAAPVTVGASSALGVLSQDVGALALPSPAVFATPASAYVPVIAITARTLI